MKFAATKTCDMRKNVITVAKGDGIGPEIMDAVISIFESARVPIDYQYVDMGKWVSPIENPFKWFNIFIFPWLTLALASAASYTRFTRSNVLETTNEDYIRTARAKGVAERVVFFKHTFRAVLAPIITLAGLDFAGLIGGAIITETIFNLPGLGRLTLRSVYEFDLPVVLATTILAAVVVIVMNLIVDILYAFIDPRVRVA